MKSGQFVKHRKTGKRGKVYSDNPMANEKVVVYFGEDKNATLCKPENLEIIGYFN